MLSNKKTLVLGASANPQRYSYLAVNRLSKYGHDVVAIGLRPGEIFGISIDTEKKLFEGIDTVTLYLNAKNQQQYYDYILSLHPKRIIFNPGTENDELEQLAKANGIKVQEAC